MTTNDGPATVLDLTLLSTGRRASGADGGARLIDPSPHAEGRWQATRCGVVDSWQWAIEEFLFHEGSAALVGPNGSGKTLNLCIFSPTLTDGDTSERALSVSAQTGAKLDDLHLGDRPRGPRTGVWWHEYGYREPGSAGQVQYFTAGLWLYKSAAESGRLQRAWFVVDQARAGAELTLSENREAVGIARLAEQLQALGGRLFTSSKDLRKAVGDSISVVEAEDGYAAAVRQKMYAPFSADQVTALTRVQRTLRSVRVSDDKLPHDFLAKILTSALPGLDEGPVKRLADVLTRTGSLEQRLENARRERDLLAEVADAYQRYAAAQATSVAAQVTHDSAGYRQAEAAERHLDVQIQAREGERQKEAALAETESAHAAMTAAELKAAFDQLAEHPGSQLDHLEQVARDAEAVAQQFADRAARDSATAEHTRALLTVDLARLEDLRRRLREMLEVTRALADKVEATPHHEPLADLCAPLIGDQPKPVDGLVDSTMELRAAKRLWIKDLLAGLDELSAVTQRLQAADEEHAKALNAFEELDLEYDRLQAVADDLQRRDNQVHQESAASLESYVASLSQLHAPEPRLLATRPLDSRALTEWSRRAHADAEHRIDLAGARKRADAAEAAAAQAAQRQDAARTRLTASVRALRNESGLLADLSGRLPSSVPAVAGLWNLATGIAEGDGLGQENTGAAIDAARDSCAEAIDALRAQAQDAAATVERALQAEQQALRLSQEAVRADREAQHRIQAANEHAHELKRAADDKAQAAITDAQRAADEQVAHAEDSAVTAIAGAETAAKSAITAATASAKAAQAQADSAARTAATTEAAWLTAVHRWAERLRVLPHNALPLPPADRRAGFDPDTLSTAVSTALLEARLRLNSERSTAQAHLDALVGHQRQVASQIEQARHSDPHPQAPDWRSTREGRMGAPLWALVDFAPGTEPDTRDRIEGALVAAGLLDAWVCDDGHISAGDTHLRPGRARAGATTLASYLVAESGEHVNTDTVRAILESIQVGDGDTGSDCLVLTDEGGEIHTGLVHARSPIGWQSRHIGATARDRARQALLEELTRQLRDLDEPLTAAREHLNSIDHDIATATDEAQALPDHAAVLDADRRATQARTGADQATKDADNTIGHATATRAADIAAATDRRDQAVAGAQQMLTVKISAAHQEHQATVESAHTALAATVAAADGHRNAARQTADAADVTAHAARDKAATTCAEIGVAADPQPLADLLRICGSLPNATASVCAAIGSATAARDDLDRCALETHACCEQRSATAAAWQTAEAEDLQAAEEFAAFPHEAITNADAAHHDAERAHQAAGTATDRVNEQRKIVHQRLTARKEAEKLRNAATMVRGTTRTLPSDPDKALLLRTGLTEFGESFEESINRAAATTAAASRVRECSDRLDKAAEVAAEGSESARLHREKADAARHTYNSQLAAHSLGLQELNQRIADLRGQHTNHEHAARRHDQAAQAAKDTINQYRGRLDGLAEATKLHKEKQDLAVAALQQLFDLGLTADVTGSEDLARPDSDHEALRVAQAIIDGRSLPASVDPRTTAARTTAALQLLDTAVREARDHLLRLGRSLDVERVAETQWHRVILRTLGTGGGDSQYTTNEPLPDALARMEKQITKLETDFTEKIQTQFKEIITRDLRKHINQRILLAGDIVADIKANLDKLRTGVANVGVRLAWDQKPDPESVKAITLIQGANSDGDFQELFDFFIGQLQHEGRIAGAEQRIGEVFDYRNWFQWKIEITHVTYSSDDPERNEVFKQITKQRNPLNELSAGEKRLVTMLPLLAALRAFYSAEGYHGPRTVFVDELNAAFDVANLRQVLGLLRTWDMDLLTTLPSHGPLLYRETGAIAINKITKLDGGLRISTPSIWDGHGPAPVPAEIAVTVEGPR